MFLKIKEFGGISFVQWNLSRYRQSTLDLTLLL